MEKEILYVDMDNVLVDFPSAFDKVDKELLEQYANDKDEIPGIFRLMDPLEGAIEAYEELSQYFDTYILSTSPWENDTALADKLNWVKKYLGNMAYKRVIFSHNKHLNAGDYLIDDRTANGAGEFKGEHIHFGTADFPDWETVKTYLLKKAGVKINISLKELDRDIANLHLPEPDMTPEASIDDLSFYSEESKKRLKELFQKRSDD